MSVLVLLFIGLHLSAQEVQESPTWVLIEEGKEALRNRQLADALYAFRAARGRREILPEAEFGIGQVYEAEQNFPLALRQYETALAQSRDLAIPSQEVLIRYHIARIHWFVQDFIRYEEVLQEMVRPYSEERQWILLNARKVLLQSGSDRMISLFRLVQDETFLAYRELGVYLVATGRDTAVDFLLFSLLQAVTPMVSYLRQIDPLYEFRGMGLLLQDMAAQNGQSFIDEVHLHQILYYLALAVRNFDPSSPTSQALFNFLADREESGKWALMAREQLQTAFLPNLQEHVPDFSLPLL